MMEEEKEGKRNGTPSGVDISVLPEERISNIIALTSPKDVCRACTASPKFHAAAKSNAVWDRFLPSDYQAIIARSSSSSDLLVRGYLDAFFSSLNFCHSSLITHHSSLITHHLKHPTPFGTITHSSSLNIFHTVCGPHTCHLLYLTLFDNPILIDDSNKSFFLEKSSSKKCYLLAARDLCIIWKVAELKSVRWFDICGKIPTSMLSPKTNYATYLVFKLRRGAHGYKPPPKASVGTNGEGEVFKQIQRISHPKLRKDGWFEIELGEIFNEGGEDDELKIRLLEVDTNIVKTSLIVEGIEIRPTKG
ncbi:hypothetical protein ACB092_05G052700 [Castanea dentata]